jgi:hypothetical protein
MKVEKGRRKRKKRKEKQAERRRKPMEKEGEEETEETEEEEEDEVAAVEAGDARLEGKVPGLEGEAASQSGRSSGSVGQGATAESDATPHTHEVPGDAHVTQQAVTLTERRPTEEEEGRATAKDPERPAVPKKRMPVTVPPSTLELRERGPWGTVLPKAVFRKGGGTR